MTTQHNPTIQPDALLADLEICRCTWLTGHVLAVCPCNPQAPSTGRWVESKRGADHPTPNVLPTAKQPPHQPGDHIACLLQIPAGTVTLIGRRRHFVQEPRRGARLRAVTVVTAQRIQVLAAWEVRHASH